MASSSSATNTNTSVNIPGLSSAIQWGDIVDATIRADEARNLTPLTNEIDQRAAQKTAWTSFKTMVDTLNENARLVRRTGFGGFTSTIPTSPTTGRVGASTRRPRRRCS